MASLRNYFAEETHRREEALAEKPQSIEDDADFERITQINDEWNRNVAKIRNERLKQERIQMREKIESELQQQRQYEEEQRKRINDLVLKEKVCVSFCTEQMHFMNAHVLTFFHFIRSNLFVRV